MIILEQGKGIFAVSHKTHIIKPSLSAVASFVLEGSVESVDENMAVLFVKDIRRGRVYLSATMPELQSKCIPDLGIS